MRKSDIDALERRVAAWSRQIDAVERALSRGDPKLRDAYRKEIAALQERREQTLARLARLRLAEAESWEQEDLQAGLFHIFDSFGRRIGRWLGRRE